MPTKIKKLVIFHHPLRSKNTWYLGYEEGNRWTKIGILRIEPEAFVALLNECDMHEVKVAHG